MDFEGWEIVPEDGYLEIQYDGGNKIFSRKYGADDPNNLCKNDCFNDEEEVKENINMEPINNLSSTSLEKIKADPDSAMPLEVDHDPVSQVFIKKMIENKSVDMKVDSPMSNDIGLIPKIDQGILKYKNEYDEILEDKKSLKKPEIDKITETKKEISDEVTWGQDTGGLNIWKLSMNGFGAICSFGVVAASICIIVLRGRQQNKHHHQQNQKVQFHIFAEDKRIKQVVHHATRLNEAISAMRGVSGVRAHITFGGHYEGL